MKGFEEWFEICEVQSPTQLRQRRMHVLAGEDPSTLRPRRQRAFGEAGISASIRTAYSLPPPMSHGSRRASSGVVSHDLSSGLAQPPPWAIGFSKQFRKDTKALDRKLQGRVLEVLEELSDYEFPFHASGDTFKPLVGELAGCWRYRIGDHRLVVQPVLQRCQLNALALGSRGSVYG